MRNRASTNGSGMFGSFASIVVTLCMFEECSVGGRRRVIAMASDGTLSVVASTFVGCLAADSGGALRLEDANARVEGSKLSTTAAHTRRAVRSRSIWRVSDGELSCQQCARSVGQPTPQNGRKGFSNRGANPALLRRPA